MSKPSPRRAALLPAGLLLAWVGLAGQAWAQQAHPEPGAALSGEVTHYGPAEPLAKAQVYVQEVSEEGFLKVLTDAEGRYVFASLPAGLFRVVAFKRGFVPVVRMLLRENRGERQELQIELREESDDIRESEDYWTVRGRIPPDILREIQSLGSGFQAPPTTLTARGGDPAALQALVPSSRSFQTRMRADSGVEQLGADRGKATWSNAAVGIQGALGETAIGVSGSFQQLRASESDLAETPTAQSHSIAVSLSRPESASVSLHSSGGEMENLRRDGGIGPVDMEHHRLSWSGRTGARGRTRLSADYTDESNYYRLGWLDPLGTPDASRTLQVEGTYSRELSAKTSLTTGVQFRQRDGSSLSFATLSERERALLEETIGLYGVADTAIRPWVVVEYGLFSQYKNGELSLMPHGGLMVQLSERWSAGTTLSQRFDGSPAEDEAGLFPRGFRSAFYGDSTSCRDVGEACYEVYFTREEGDAERLKVGAVHREYAETLRLYFDDEFFNRLESLFLVEGDTLQELSFRMVRRLTPKVLATLSSNLAAGGGGIFYATDSKAYENEVRYLVTSLDTHFQQTDTGVFVAFHHLQQALSDMEGRTGDQLEMQRLQLMLTQDLRVLADMAANWKLRVNMEVSRGATPYTLSADDELYKKLTGGLSISF